MVSAAIRDEKRGDQVKGTNCEAHRSLPQKNLFFPQAVFSIVFQRPLKCTAGCDENFIKPELHHYEGAIFMPLLPLIERGDADFSRKSVLFHPYPCPQQTNEIQKLEENDMSYKRRPPR